MARDFLERLRDAAAKQGSAGKLVNVALAATILAKNDPDNLLNGIKLAAAVYGKPVVKATLGALIEAAMED